MADNRTANCLMMAIPWPVKPDGNNLLGTPTLLERSILAERVSAINNGEHGGDWNRHVYPETIHRVLNKRYGRPETSVAVP